MMPAALSTSGLGKRYGSHWALRDCELSLPTGRMVALVGPNGAGKTTLMHLAVGLLVPTAGEILVHGHAPETEPLQVLARVGFVAQDRPLYRRITVGDTLDMGRRLNVRWDSAFAAGRLRGLGIPFDRQVGRLSGGQQAQVALTLALGKRPDLLLLDEPLANLDPLARREFLTGLAEACRTDGLTIVFSSHVVAELERTCDYLVILREGRVQVAGQIDEVVSRFAGAARDDKGAPPSMEDVVLAYLSEPAGDIRRVPVGSAGGCV